MKSMAFTILFGGCALCLTAVSNAQEIKGPTQFNLAILDQDAVTFVLPSALIVDERGKVSGLTFTVTSHTKKEQGFAIDQVRVKEIVTPGETKTIKLSVTPIRVCSPIIAMSIPSTSAGSCTLSVDIRNQT